MWSLLATALGWLLSLFKPKDGAQQRKDDLDLGAAKQRDIDRGTDGKIVRDAERAVKRANQNARDTNDLDAGT